MSGGASPTRTMSPWAWFIPSRARRTLARLSEVCSWLGLPALTLPKFFRHRNVFQGSAFRISHSAFRTPHSELSVSVVVALRARNRPCSRRFPTPLCLADACRIRTVTATSDVPRVAAEHALRSGSRPFVGGKAAAECGLRSAEGQNLGKVKASSPSRTASRHNQSCAGGSRVW